MSTGTYLNLRLIAAPGGRVHRIHLEFEGKPLDVTAWLPVRG